VTGQAAHVGIRPQLVALPFDGSLDGIVTLGDFEPPAKDLLDGLGAIDGRPLVGVEQLLVG